MNRRSFLKFFGVTTASVAVPAVATAKPEEERVNPHAFLEMCEPEENLKEFQEYWEENRVQGAYHMGVRDALYAVHNHFTDCKCEGGTGCHPDMHKATAQILRLMRKRLEGEVF